MGLQQGSKRVEVVVGEQAEKGEERRANDLAYSASPHATSVPLLVESSLALSSLFLPHAIVRSSSPSSSRHSAAGGERLTVPVGPQRLSFPFTSFSVCEEGVGAKEGVTGIGEDAAERDESDDMVEEVERLE